MTGLRQVGIGVSSALLSGLLVLGALSAASAEGQALATPTQANTATAGLPILDQATATSRPSATPLPPTACPSPANWESYTLQEGDTLASLAAARGISAEELSEVNCLSGQVWQPGARLFLPPLPTGTPSSTPSLSPTLPSATATPTTAASATRTPPQPTGTVCGHPDNWIAYTIRPGDTLYSLANLTGTTVSDLMVANCLTDTNIIAGATLYLPRWPWTSATPTASRTATHRAPTKTSVPPTHTAILPTDTLPVSTATATLPTDTPLPPTDTAEPTSVSLEPTVKDPTLPGLNWRARLHDDPA